MGEIVTVNFRGDQLYGFKQDDGAFIALRAVCEGMGIGYDGQRQRVNRDPVLKKAASIMLAPFASTGGQEVLCLRLDRLNFWLATIDSGRIKDEAVRERVILYQEECADVLHAHFMSGKAVERRAYADVEPTEEETKSVKLSHVREVRYTFNAQAAREVYFALGLLVTPSMLRPAQAELFTYTAIRQDAA